MDVDAPDAAATDRPWFARYLDELIALASLHDIEQAHERADQILCELLRLHGYDQIVDAWEDIKKWYA